MNFVNDPAEQKQLYPFTLTRPVEDIRVGILTIREKWNLYLGDDYEIDIPANLLPSASLVEFIKRGEAIPNFSDVVTIEHPWQIFQRNDMALRDDFRLITQGRASAQISSTNQLISPENIFLEDGAKMEYCTVNASTGPVYIGKNAELMEGCIIRGPLALCEGAVLKLGTKIYGATTLGPYSVGGGEIKNSILFGYSNKAHDGYLGDSVIGEWCNLGAGTTNSNLRNNAGELTVWSEAASKKIVAGLKCGLLMGDYSRTAINTSLNTGTVVGVSCNIFGGGLQPTHIPSFSWAGAEINKYHFEKAIEAIANWKKLKKHSLTEAEITRLKHIFDNY